MPQKMGTYTSASKKVCTSCHRLVSLHSNSSKNVLLQKATIKAPLHPVFGSTTGDQSLLLSVLMTLVSNTLDENMPTTS
eukprot:CCRYP_015150-RE/>CCRYP_015150-RE protein AED:0.46 eAED:0.46 QI:0/-1/0/1/-1/0/1/0/78